VNLTVTDSCRGGAIDETDFQTECEQT